MRSGASTQTKPNYTILNPTEYKNQENSVRKMEETRKIAKKPRESLLEVPGYCWHLAFEKVKPTLGKWPNADSVIAAGGKNVPLICTGEDGVAIYYHVSVGLDTRTCMLFDLAGVNRARIGGFFPMPSEIKKRERMRRDKELGLAPRERRCRQRRRWFTPFPLPEKTRVRKFISWRERCQRRTRREKIHMFTEAQRFFFRDDIDVEEFKNVEVISTPKPFPYQRGKVILPGEKYATTLAGKPGLFYRVARQEVYLDEPALVFDNSKPVPFFSYGTIEAVTARMARLRVITEKVEEEMRYAKEVHLQKWLKGKLRYYFEVQKFKGRVSNIENQFKKQYYDEVFPKTKFRKVSEVASERMCKEFDHGNGIFVTTSIPLIVPPVQSKTWKRVLFY